MDIQRSRIRLCDKMERYSYNGNFLRIEGWIFSRDDLDVLDLASRQGI